MEEKSTEREKISTLEIDGEYFKFRVSEKQDADALRDAAALISKTIMALRKSNVQENYHRLLLIACLHLCDESALGKLLSSEKEIQNKETLLRIEKKLQGILEAIALTQIVKD